jgi:hypothetical protein
MHKQGEGGDPGGCLLWDLNQGKTCKPAFFYWFHP